eukprot:1290041-Amphidinium_carterae.1
MRRKNYEDNIEENVRTSETLKAWAELEEYYEDYHWNLSYDRFRKVLQGLLLRELDLSYIDRLLVNYTAFNHTTECLKAAFDDRYAGLDTVKVRRV